MVNIFTAMTHTGRRTWNHFVRVLAMVVVFCTTYALILPAITLEQKATCGIVEHTHTDECYQVVEPTQCNIPESEGHAHSESCYTYEENALACGMEEVEAHTHSDECNGQILLCILEEAEAHTHSEACTAEVSTLICAEEESEAHAHGDACYQVETQQTCGLEETEGHAHIDSCYKEGMTCGLPEGKGHAHAAVCYGTLKTLACSQEESEGHSHANDVTDPVREVICEIVEHTHTEECYPETEATDESTEETTLPAGDPNADVETAADWEASMVSVELKGDWSEDLLNIARSQMGYTESTKNYIVNEDDSISGYTRYGAWYGIPYGDWCAMFVSFCLEYAEVGDISRAAGCGTWMDDLKENKQYKSADEYIPVPGDIIFINWDEDNRPDHVGIVEQIITPEVAENPEEQEPVKVRVIEGNSSNRVQYVDYAIDDESIMGYGILPTEHGPTYEYSDDSVQVSVVLPLDTTVPETAVLSVTPIESGDDGYDDMVEKANNAVEGTVTKIKLYDISFYTESGEYIPVDDEAKVSLRFVEKVVDANANVEVLHFAEDNAEPVVLAGVTVEEQVPVEEEEILTLDQLEEAQTEATEQTEATAPAEVATETVVEFKTDGFSMFAVVEVEFNPAVTTYKGTALRNKAGNGDDTPPDLDGKTLMVVTAEYFALSGSAVDGRFAMKAEPSPNNALRLGTELVTRIQNDITVTTSDIDKLLWEFETTGTADQYYIKSAATGEYIYQNGNDLTLSATNRTAFYAYNGHGTTYTVMLATGNTADNNSTNGREIALADNPTELFYQAANNPAYDGKAAQLLLVDIGETVERPAVQTNEVDAVVAGQDHPLNGKVLAIASAFDGKQYAETGNQAYRAVEPTLVNNKLSVSDITKSDINYTVSGTAFWKFEAVAGKANTYYIRSHNYYSGTDGAYMQIQDNQAIALVAAPDANGRCEIVVSDDPRADDAGFINLQRNEVNNSDRFLAYDADLNNITAYDSNVCQDDFVLLEEAKIQTREVDAVIAGQDHPLNGKVLGIVSANDGTNTIQLPEQIYRGVNTEIINGNKLSVSTASKNGDIYSISDTAFWRFEAVKDKPNTYYIRVHDYYSGVDGAYLQIEDGEGISLPYTGEDYGRCEIVVSEDDGDDAGFVNLRRVQVNNSQRTLAYNYDDNLITAYNNNDWQDDFVLVEELNIQTREVDAVMDGQDHPLANRVLAIASAFDGKTGNETGTQVYRGVETTITNGNKLQVSSIVKLGDIYTVSGTAFWKFEPVTGKRDTYYIRAHDYYTGEDGEYLQIQDGEGVTFVNEITPDGRCEIVVSEDAGKDAGLVNMRRNPLPEEQNYNGYNRCLAYNVDLNFVTAYNNNEEQDDFILLETLNQVDEPVYALGLENAYYMLLGINFREDDPNPNVAAVKLMHDPVADVGGMTGFRAENVDNFGSVNNDEKDLTEQNFNTYQNATWYFEASGTPGSYYIRMATDAELGQYLNITENGLVLSNNPQPIQVVNATTPQEDGYEDDDRSAICLRTADNLYVNLYTNWTTGSFTTLKGDANSTGDRGNHILLAEFVRVNDAIDDLIELLAGMEVNANGTLAVDARGNYYFTSKALAGSAGPDSRYCGTNQGDDDDDFQIKYDNAVDYRNRMRELAQNVFDVLNNSTDAREVAYLRNAIEAYTGEDADTVIEALDWLGQKPNVVPAASPKATVELFNYDSAVNDGVLGQAGFTFYHENRSNGYTAEDGNGKSSDSMGRDDERMDMSAYLDANDAPVIVYGNGAQQNLSMSSLLGVNSGYRVTTMDNGGGLFQYDAATGYYYYHSDRNAASWDQATNNFILYDTVIRPMYINPGDLETTGYTGNIRDNGTPNEDYRNSLGLAAPLNPTDRYNFLPFNDASKVIMDEPGTMHTSTSTNGTLVERRSGYLNEQADMWFGMTIKTEFFQPNDGKVERMVNGEAEEENMVFRFFGDDDVFVYINGVLVLDIGGTHRASAGTIDFATGEVYYENFPMTGGVEVPNHYSGNIRYLMIERVKADGSVTTDEDALDKLKTMGIEFQEVTLDNGTKSWTLKEFRNYDFKFYYMERGGNVSYNGIEFNLLELPRNSLTIQKEFDLNGAIDSGKTFTYKVLQVGDDGKPTDKSYFDPGTEYSVYNAENQLVRKTTVTDEGYIYLKGGEHALLNDIFDNDNWTKPEDIPNYVVQEILSTGEYGQYSVEYKVTGEEVYTTIDEPEAVNDSGVTYHYAYQSSVVNIVDYPTAVVDYINTPGEPMGKLAIEKRLESDIVPYAEGQAEQFTFKIELANVPFGMDPGTYLTDGYVPIPQGTPYMLYEVGDNDTLTLLGERTVTSTDGTIQLEDCQRAVFSGFLAETYFRVSEVLGADQHYKVVYDAKILEQGDGDGLETVVEFNASYGSGQFGFDGDTAYVKATNTDSLTDVSVNIRKVIENWPGVASFEFSAEQVDFDTEEQKIVAFVEDASNTTVTTAKNGEIDSIGNGLLRINYLRSAVGEATTEGLNEVKYYYAISEVQGTDYFVYDQSVYVIEVTLSRENNDTDEWSAEVTNAWKAPNRESDFEVYEPADDTSAGTDDGIFDLEFLNYRYAKIIVNKQVLADDPESFGTFPFEVSVSIAGEAYDLTLNKENAQLTDIEDGSIADGDISFELADDESIEIYLPYNSTVIVKETDFDGYYVQYELTWHDNGAVSGSNSGNASGYGGTVEYTIKGETNITITNTPGEELPKTGGTGTLMYTLGGLFMMASPVVYGFGKRRRRERRAD